MERINFPDGFLWGAAISSHQVEGYNVNNDWWQWETQGETIEPSGKACRHYELFEDDFNLAKSLNLNSFRFSIEWSRVQPKADEWNDEEILHYKKVISALRERSLEPIITLHHFTNPVWFNNLGGWEDPKSALYFAKYTQRMFNEFGAECRYWITINEPLVYVYNSYIRGIWPPGVKSLSRAKNVISNLINAHKQAYWIIHRIAQERCYYFPLVSIAKNMRVFLPCRVASPLDRLATYLRTRAFNFYFLDKIKNHLDFIGVNYYTREFVRFTRFRDRAQASSSSDLFGQTCESSHHARRKKNYLDWESYPEGLFSILMSLKKYGLPILITENGTCDDDESRFQFILEHLKQLNRAIKVGVNVFGYLYWSLIDNFEWEHGFSPRFGLIEVDYSNYQRKIRTSGLKYAKICQANCIENIE